MSTVEKAVHADLREQMLALGAAARAAIARTGSIAESSRTRADSRS
jgi:hypothetical protein